MAKRLSSAAILMLVALRLATGWHFYNEGSKKLEPGFSSAGFLRGAKGPLEPLCKSFVKGPHGAFQVLGAPAELGSRPAEAAAELARWEAGLAKRVEAATGAGEPLPSDAPGSAPYRALLENLDDSWTAGLRRLSRLSGSEAFLAEAERTRQALLGEATYYFAGEREAIDELQHEAWRLDQLRGGAGEAPFQQALFREKEAEVWSTMQPWAWELKNIETAQVDALVAAAAKDPDAPSGVRIRSALAERSALAWIDFGVKVVVLGSGVCLFLGLLTPVAAVLAACFLCSVIATQPPWAHGADTTYFFYQVVEVFALLVLAATGAGRWAGLDGVYATMAARNSPAPDRVASTPNTTESAATDVA